jgi:hypothetical protein
MTKSEIMAVVNATFPNAVYQASKHPQVEDDSIMIDENIDIQVEAFSGGFSGNIVTKDNKILFSNTYVKVEGAISWIENKMKENLELSE